MAIVSANGAAAPLSPNVIINGAFDVWQRGTSFSASGYTADRWTGDFVTGAGTVSQQAFPPGAAPVQGYEGTYFLRRAVTTGAQFSSLIHRIEDVRTFAGQTVTLSFWAKGTGPTGGYSVNLLQNFGSGGSAQTNLADQYLTLTSSWTRYSFTFTLGSISGKTIGANSFLWLSIYQTLSNTSASTLDIWGVQLEAGSVATPFRRNANSIQGELAACQRYYWRQTSASASDGYYGFATGFANSTTSAWVSPFFPVQMRVAPSFGSSAASTFQMFNNGGIVNATSLALGRSGVISATINVGAASGLVANAGLTFESRNTASAYLEFSAEL